MTDYTPLLSASDIAALRRVYTDGMGTVGEWNGWPVVTFTRRDASTDTVTCISIRLADRQQRETGAGISSAESEFTGILKAFGAAFVRPVRQGDRFTWNGQRCVVTAGPFEKNGVVEVNFALELGNT